MSNDPFFVLPLIIDIASCLDRILAFCQTLSKFLKFIGTKEIIYILNILFYHNSNFKKINILYSNGFLQ
ncbi:hypothetical protein AR546_20890 [Leptospira interrogans serovar Canicola]|nr:hypothetical protein B2G50_07420 [Leptospira interrogans serovar Canicola]EMK15858.1 hypothetical protein LEP1GSC075_1320 [Leptospira interrogans str. Kito]EMN76159.1 hypothetical protein LEP1GSC102_0686 [Leptospira interrogans str. UI 09600]OLZ29491.1 hypothetical protein AR546_20890 [Leptospira interrogans serovar Canicola]POR17519.1 hypothetical protein B0T34_14615 [Leptospira interrogans serovar Canicola]